MVVARGQWFVQAGGGRAVDACLGDGAYGGVNEFAAPDRSDLFRRNKDETSATYPVRLDRILNRGDLSTNYTVAPGDVIVIPERTF